MAQKSSFSVRVEGLSKSEGLPGGMDRAQRVFMGNAGKRLRTQLAEHTPKKTGRLARSWRHQVDGLTTLRLINDQPYAKAQDRGAFIRPKRGRFLRFTVGGREVFVRSVRLKPQNFAKKGLRGRGRIMQEEFAKAFNRIGGL